MNAEEHRFWSILLVYFICKASVQSKNLHANTINHAHVFICVNPCSSVANLYSFVSIRVIRGTSYPVFHVLKHSGTETRRHRIRKFVFICVICGNMYSLVSIHAIRGTPYPVFHVWNTVTQRHGDTGSEKSVFICVICSNMYSFVSVRAIRDQFHRYPIGKPKLNA